MPDPRLRDATPDDLDEICSLIRELAAYERMEDEVVFAREVVAEHLFGPAPSARVTIASAEPGGPVAGMALWYTTFSTFLGVPGIWLEDLFVRPEFRGHGLGKALLVDLRTRTSGRVEWSVLDWNEPSIGFYDALGAGPVAGWIRYRWDPQAP